MEKRITKRDGSFEIPIAVLIFNQGEHVISWCPALELSAFGKDESQALERFDSEMQIFLSFYSEKGSLFTKLKSLGWTISTEGAKQPDTKEVPLNVLGSLQKHQQSITVPAYA